MAPQAQPDPFQQWREQQRAAAAAIEPHPPAATRLSPGREARRDLAIYAAVDAVRNHQPDARDRIDALLRVDTHVKAEQSAETGHIPDTFEGCLAVLNAAASIIETLADVEELP